MHACMHACTVCMQRKRTKAVLFSFYWSSERCSRKDKTRDRQREREEKGIGQQRTSALRCLCSCMYTRSLTTREQSPFLTSRGPVRTKLSFASGRRSSCCSSSNSSSSCSCSRECILMMRLRDGDACMRMQILKTSKKTRV